METLIKKTSSGFEYIETFPKDLKTDKQFLIFHGYGGDAMNLQPLAAAIDPNAKWIFPNAPMNRIEIRSWFEFHIENILACENFSYSDVMYLALSFIKEFDLNFDNLILGGFSQGAVIASLLAMSGDLDPKKLMIFSGFFLPIDKDLKKLSSPKKIFHTHGLSDEVISFKRGEELNQKLRDCNWVGDLIPFEEGHSIPLEVSQKARLYAGN